MSPESIDYKKLVSGPYKMWTTQMPAAWNLLTCNLSPGDVSRDAKMLFEISLSDAKQLFSPFNPSAI